MVEKFKNTIVQLLFPNQVVKSVYTFERAIRGNQYTYDDQNQYNENV